MKRLDKIEGQGCLLFHRASHGSHISGGSVTGESQYSTPLAELMAPWRLETAPISQIWSQGTHRVVANIPSLAPWRSTPTLHNIFYNCISTIKFVRPYIRAVTSMICQITPCVLKWITPTSSDLFHPVTKSWLLGQHRPLQIHLASEKWPAVKHVWPRKALWLSQAHHTQLPADLFLDVHIKHINNKLSHVCINICTHMYGSIDQRTSYCLKVMVQKQLVSSTK